MINLLNKWRTNIVAILLLLLVWQCFYYIAHEPIIFPDLFTVAVTAIQVIPTKLFWSTYSQTLLTLLEAWLIALVIVSIVVSVCFVSHNFRKIFERYCSYFMPLPSFVIIPFVTLLLGLGKLSLLIVMVFSVFWSMSYQLLGAFDTVRLTWDKQIANLKWNFYESITRVYIPAAAPTLLSLSSMSWTYMWRVLVSLEVAYGAIGGYYGLGSYMIEVKNKLDVAIMYVILIVIAVTGVIINSFIESLRTKVNW
ncbi:ABC transporter permease subunit [bacterium]|nr:ABC transporter permease subunit [bacterium]